MSTELPIEISRHDWEELRRVLETYVPDLEVWAFGSRAKGTSKRYSDLDLAIISEDKIPLATMAELRDHLDSSDLTIKVDVVDWAATDPSFRRAIEHEKVVLRKRKGR